MGPKSDNAATSLAEQVSKLYDSKHLADITLNLLGSDGVELEAIPAHSLLLRIQSCTLNARFEFEMKQRGGEPPREVEIVMNEEIGLNLKAFKGMLEFMYTGQAELAVDNIVDVMVSGECLGF